MVMTGPSTGPVTRCPFAHCAADVMLVIEQASAGDDEGVLKRVPQHAMVGDASRFGQCPASLMVIPLDAYCRESLKTQAQALSLMLPAGNPRDPRGDALPRSKAPEHPLTPHPDPRHPFNRWNGRAETRTGGVNVPQDGNPGRSVVPLPDEPHAGPGPGRASMPHPPRARDVEEIVARPKLQIIGPQDRTQGSGTDMTNDLRAQLISLTSLAIEGFGQEQENCAALTGKLDEFEAILAALGDKQQATHSLALAAVGSRADVPRAAADMIGSSAGAGSAVEGLLGAVAGLRYDVDTAHAAAGSAAASAREYLAMI